MPRFWNQSTWGTVILVLAVAAALWTINRGFPELELVEALPGAAKPTPVATPASHPAAPLSHPAAPVSHPASSAVHPAGGRPVAPPDTKQVHDVTIRDLDGRVVFRGTVDLTKTLERIDRGQRLHFHDDGSSFHNHERHLPSQPAGYYTEYVHPTPHLGGPGPQRVVTGRRGEIYYTPDHYRTFVRLK